MQPFEGIKTRQMVTGHPESCRVRPHSKGVTLQRQKLGGNPTPGGGGAMVLRSYGAAGRAVLMPGEGHSTRSPLSSPVAMTTGCVSPPPDYANIIKQHPAPSPFKLTHSYAVGDSTPMLCLTDRKESVTVSRLVPLSPCKDSVKAKLKRLDLDTTIAEAYPALRSITPRFHCPKNVDCVQGHGRQYLPNFALNPDEGAEGVDQALYYHVQTQGDDLFLEVPTCDTSGGLGFTPSLSRQGVARCAVMATDHAAITDDIKGFKSSTWVGFTITVHPQPTKTLKARDWRTFYNKMTAPTAAVPVPDRLLGTSPGGSTDGGLDVEPSLRHLFPPVDIHSLRIQPEQKTNRDKTLLLAKYVTPLRPWGYLMESVALRDGIPSKQEAANLLDQQLTTVTDLAGGAHVWDNLREDPMAPIENSTEHILALALATNKLGKVYYATCDVPEAGVCFERSISMHSRYVGAGDAVYGSDGWLDALSEDVATGQNLLAAVYLHVLYLKNRGDMPRAAEEAFIGEKLAVIIHEKHNDLGSASYTVSFAFQKIETLLVSGDVPAAISSLEELRLTLDGVLPEGRGEKMSEWHYLYAVAYVEQNKFDKAQRAVQQCIGGRKKQMGADHPSVAEGFLLKSKIHDLSGKAEQCVKAAQDAVEVAEKRRTTWTAVIFHVFTIVSLSQSYVAKGKYSLSLPLLEKAEERCHDLTPSHPISGVGQLALGAFHASQHRYTQAASCLTSAEATLTPSQDNLILGLMKAVSASVAMAQGLGVYDEVCQAEKMLCHAMPHRAAVQSMVAELRGDAEVDPLHALEHYTRAYGLIRKIGKVEKELRLFRVMSQLCGVYCAGDGVVPGVGLIEEFKEFLREKQAAYGEWDYQTCPMLQCIAELCFAAGSYEDCTLLLQRMLKISDNQNLLFLLGHLFKPAAQLTETQIKERNRLACEKAASGSAPSFAATLLQLAAVQEARHMWPEAEATYLQARATLEISGKPTHPGVCSALNGIGRILYNSGLYGDALSYFQKTVEVAEAEKGVHTENYNQALSSIQIVNKKLQGLRYLLERYEVPGGDLAFPVYI